MYSLRDPEGNRSIVRRIASLDKRNDRQWGKMSGAQMLAHCPLVRRFGEDGPKLDKHPFFGPMSTEDWDRLNWKHLDHHLRQFNA